MTETHILTLFLLWGKNVKVCRDFVDYVMLPNFLFLNDFKERDERKREARVDNFKVKCKISKNPVRSKYWPGIQANRFIILNGTKPSLLL